MTFLLIPGRHHLLTRFQEEYISKLAGDGTAMPDTDGIPLGKNIDEVVWAITSANHAGTRRNPIPGHRREAAIEALGTRLPIGTRSYHVDDIGATPDFAAYTIKKVLAEGGPSLTPENTIVGCSTPEVIEMYARLGFRVAPMELDKEGVWVPRTPWQLLNAIAENPDWRTDAALLRELHPATLGLLEKYGLGDRIVEINADPLGGDDGDITETRDYNTYFRALDEGAPRKYELLAPFMVPGRIADIGSCTGALIREMTYDGRLRESDFFGIEVARPLYVESVHRKEAGFFGNDNVFFYQRNISLKDLFPPHAVHTFTTVSLTHEIASYQGMPALTSFIEALARQTTHGGRWLNLDVVGPEDRGREVYLLLNDADGGNEDIHAGFPDRATLREHLTGLSTAARFERFASDFRAGEGERVAYARETIGGIQYVRTTLETAAEFLSKKEYTDNWESEMHERFCALSFSDWRLAVEGAGFKVHPASHAFTNPWIVEHRYRGAVSIFTRDGDAMREEPYPVTNMLLIGELP